LIGVRHLSVLLLTMLAACVHSSQRPPRLAHSTLACARTVVAQKVPRHVRDKVAHCRAAGFIARYCSVPEAYLAGAGKEVLDLFSNGDAEWADWRADRVGIQCDRGATSDEAIAACCTEHGD
jgi:hypothetical protein